MGGRERVLAAATSLLVPIAGGACAPESAVLAAVQAPVLYPGTAEAPIVGLLFPPDPTAEPVVYYRDLGGAVEPRPGRVRVAPGVEAFFSDDWRHVVLAERTGQGTRVQYDEQGPFVLASEEPLGVVVAGETLVAYPRNVRLDGESEVRVLDGRGADQAGLTVRGVRSIALSGSGNRVAIAGAESVQVVARSGGSPAVIPASAERVALSEDGAILALDHGRTLEIVRLDALSDPSREVLGVPDEASVLRFVPPRWLVRASPRQLLVLDASVHPPARVRAESPPPGFAWRDGDVGPRGEVFGSRIRVDRAARREGRGEDPFRPGVAHVAVDRYLPDEPGPSTVEWGVERWNAASPSIRFGPDGRLHAIVWPKAFEVVFP